MAQQNLWNPYGPNSDQQGDPDFQTQQQQQAQAQQPSTTDQPQTQQNGGYDLDAWYQRTLGRAPDANERSSDMENIGKYGASAFESDFMSKRPSNQPGGGSSSSSSTTMATGGMPDWYKSWFDDMRSRADAAELERKQKADALYNTWLGRAQQSTNIDRNDPIIRAQADAYSANEERARRNYIGDLAESAGPLANIRGEQRMAAERTGQRTGAFEAELMGRELTARRNEIAQALTSMTGILSADQQAGLQRELAILDQAIKERGLGLQAQSLDQDWQRALLQNNQFMSDLGLRAENQYNYWNDPLRGV